MAKLLKANSLGQKDQLDRGGFSRFLNIQFPVAFVQGGNLSVFRRGAARPFHLPLSLLRPGPLLLKEFEDRETGPAQLSGSWPNSS